MPEDDYAWLDDDPENWPVPDEPVRKPCRERGENLKRRKRFKTDRDGLFRWAKIKAGRHVNRGSRPQYEDWSSPEKPVAKDATYNERQDQKRYSGPWPIELLPSDLIGETYDEDPVEIRLEPLNFWKALCAEYQYGRQQINQFRILHRRAITGVLNAPVLVPP